MDLVKIKDLAYQLMKDRKAHLDREKGYIFYHGERVSKLALKLRERLLPGDSSYDEYIVVAALFHDIGKGFQPHEKYGALLVQEILKDYCSKREIEIIAELISYHQGPRKDNRLSDYIKIIQDADILDRFGTMKVWLHFHESAMKDLPLSHTLDFFQNEFKINANRMRNLLNYDLSEKIFDEKMEFLETFIKRLNIESEGGIYI